MANENTEASPTGDPLIEQSEEATADARRAARAANLFDIRRLIGGLFLIYSVILIILGLGESDASIEKSAGLNVNLWSGVGMLVLAAFFIAWALMRPMSDALDEDDGNGGPGEGDRTVKGAPAPVGADAAALAGTRTTKRPIRSRDRPSGGSGTG
jgi:hypothetical protein